MGCLPVKFSNHVKTRNKILEFLVLSLTVKRFQRGFFYYYFFLLFRSIQSLSDRSNIYFTHSIFLKASRFCGKFPYFCSINTFVRKLWIHYLLSVNSGSKKMFGRHFNPFGSQFFPF